MKPCVHCTNYYAAQIEMLRAERDKEQSNAEDWADKYKLTEEKLHQSRTVLGMAMATFMIIGDGGGYDTDLIEASIMEFLAVP